ncbi:MAG: hypothetical protein R3330_10690 [Saprospiraceae bacterium]|nr:hypothetical protein [Saprospiraceae bacterium]
MSVFKAKVIEHPEFYRKRRQMALAGLFSSVLTSVVVIPLEGHITYLVISMMLGVLVALYQKQFVREMKALSERRRLHMTESAIQLVNKEGAVIRHIDANRLREVALSGKHIDTQTIADHLNELRGKPLKNYISLQSDEGETRIDFVVDSHYMMVQLNKILEVWGGRGIAVTMANRIPSLEPASRS